MARQCHFDVLYFHRARIEIQCEFYENLNEERYFVLCVTKFDFVFVGISFFFVDMFVDISFGVLFFKNYAFELRNLSSYFILFEFFLLAFQFLIQIVDNSIDS